MKRLKSRHVRWVGIAMASALTLVSFLANSFQTDEDRQKVAKMTGTMKTVCVGRFLIDLPAEATVRLRRGFVGGYDVASTDRETDDDFTERLGALENTLLDGKDEYGKLESAKDLLSATGQGKVFVHNRRPAQTIENGHIVAIEDVDVHGLLRLPHVSIDAQAQGMAPGSEAGLARVLRRFRAMQPGEIPREPGFCLGHAIVLDPYDDADTERPPRACSNGMRSRSTAGRCSCSLRSRICAKRRAPSMALTAMNWSCGCASPISRPAIRFSGKCPGAGRMSTRRS
jgi:hypothetical protein